MVEIKKINLALWLIPGVMCLLALAPLPYGYYTLLRIVVCIAAAAIAYYIKEENSQPIWFFVFLSIAILFNPIIPIHLSF